MRRSQPSFRIPLSSFYVTDRLTMRVFFFRASNSEENGPLGGLIGVTTGYQDPARRPGL